MKSKICIHTRNITGMTHIVTGIFAQLDISIAQMEVIPGKIFIKTDVLQETDYQQLSQALQKSEHILKVEEIFYLPSEMEQQNLEAILAVMKDLVIAVDVMGNIILQNNSANDTLRSSGNYTNIAQYFGRRNEAIVRQILKGAEFKDEELWLQTTNAESPFYLTTSTLYDPEKQVIGSVIFLVAANQVRDYAQSLQRPELNSFSDIIYKSQAMEATIERARQAAKSDVSVLLLGESGTGKELFARAVHNASARANMPFVPINCAAIPDTLIESELFGYVPGAFTGAGNKRKIGLLEYADGGTLFLDEIGELPLLVQAKLLRVLQDGKVRRIGANEQIQVNFRLIAATNKNLEDRIEKNEFRNDLYYRINVVPVKIPPLRERKNDILPLVAALSQRLVGLPMHEVVGEEAQQKLISHNWPGNVRELENALQRSFSLMTPGTVLQPEHILLDRDAPVLTGSANAVAIHKITTLTQIRHLAESELIRFAMAKYKSTRQLAKALGVSHMTIANKINQYKLRS
jgi:TyrR family helix-turn-helix protein